MLSFEIIRKLRPQTPILGTGYASPLSTAVNVQYQTSITLLQLEYSVLVYIQQDEHSKTNNESDDG